MPAGLGRWAGKGLLEACAANLAPRHKVEPPLFSHQRRKEQEVATVLVEDGFLLAFLIHIFVLCISESAKTPMAIQGRHFSEK